MAQSSAPRRRIPAWLELVILLVVALVVSVGVKTFAVQMFFVPSESMEPLFITHDLRVAAQICDRIAVMQRGVIVELKPTAQLFASPEHPYTRELLGAVPGQSSPSQAA